MTTWRDDLRVLIEAIAAKDAPDAIGELARGQAVLQARLVNGKAPDAPPRAYTAFQVGELLNRDVSWVRRHRDQLGAIKADGAVLYPEVGLRRFLQGAR